MPLRPSQIYVRNDEQKGMTCPAGNKTETAGLLGKQTGHCSSGWDGQEKSRENTEPKGQVFLLNQ